MRIRELLAVESIDLNAKAASKKEALDHAVDLMARSGKIGDVETYRKGVYAREEEGTTGIGEGIAIPHCKSDVVKAPGLAAMRVAGGVDFQSLDGEKADLIFLIAAPNTKDNVHLDVLSKLSVLLMDEKFTNDLRNAKSVEEFLHVIDVAESAKDVEEAKEAPAKTETKGGRLILAVTGCPTGIAHTYMAAESLEKKAAELGYRIKVETRGSGGAKNVLTRAEIAEADCIIVAADTQVPMERFDGKPVIECKVADGISKAEELIKRAINGDAATYHASNKEAANRNDNEKDSVGHQIYKHLMNGVSHMLPFVIGGGILIALAFLLDDYSIDPSNFGKNTPLAAYLKTIGEQAFGMMLPILAGFIAMSIADRPGLAVGLVAGLIAKMGSTFANPAGGDVNAGFLGALFAGFAGGYIVLGLKKLFSKLPKSLEGIKPVLLYPVIGIFLAAVVTTFINPYMGMINDGLTHFLNGMGGTSRVVLGMILGGMMSIDMGGPFNKAAYVFGTAQLAEGNFEVMAAVMAGGMVPPIAIALCTTFFKKKFTEKERQSGVVNYVMGLSFITEGAIPFAAQDPLRVIPSCLIGSAIAGGLSMAFGCTLRAPHGGLFVLPTIGNPVMYLAAVVIGAVVGCLILGILKKNVEE